MTKEQRIKNIVSSINEIAFFNGSIIIKDKLREELEELLEVLERNDDIHIMEEMADVSIMILQVILHSGTDEELLDEIERKLKRTVERLGI